jgi:hypothetical protein
MQAGVLDLDVGDAASRRTIRPEAYSFATVTLHVDVANVNVVELLVGVIDVEVNARRAVGIDAAADEVEIGDRDAGGLGDVDAGLVAALDRGPAVAVVAEDDVPGLVAAFVGLHRERAVERIPAMKKHLVAGIELLDVDAIDRLPRRIGRTPGERVIPIVADIVGREQLPALERLHQGMRGLVRSNSYSTGVLSAHFPHSSRNVTVRLWPKFIGLCERGI